MTLQERLDRAIMALAPTWGAERLAARLAAESAERLSDYRGANRTRLDREAGTSRGASPDWTLERDYTRRALVDRARQLEHNSVLAEGMLSRSQESVVGNGFVLQSKSSDDAWNAQAEKLWKEWTEDQADSRGMCPFGELLGLVFRSYLRDGDVGTVLLSNGQLRVVESDEIATPQGFQAPNLVDGIELDGAGKPTTYHVISNPRMLVGDRRAVSAHTLIPSENVIFLARRRRAGQTRGVSAFAGTTWILDQIDGNIEAVTVAARMAACFGLVIKRRARANGLTTETGADGVARRKLRVEPGSFFEVEPDEDVKQVQAAQPTTNFPDFLRTLARIAGVAFGLPVELLMMDFERTNYSNARAALLQAWNVWRVHQRMLKRYCTRVYQWKLLQWMESGSLAVRADAFEHGWIAPGWQWIDPVNEIQSTLAAIDAGLETRANAIMRLGYDPDEQWTQLEKEYRLLEEKGIPVVRSTLTRDPIEPEPEETQAEKAQKQASDGVRDARLKALEGRAASDAASTVRSLTERLGAAEAKLSTPPPVFNIDARSTTTIEPGAVHVPVDARSATTIAAGAVQVETPVDARSTVDARTTIEPGAVALQVAGPVVTVPERELTVNVKGGDKVISFDRAGAPPAGSITGATVTAVDPPEA